MDSFVAARLSGRLMCANSAIRQYLQRQEPEGISELANNEAVMRQQIAQIIAKTTPLSRFDSPVQVVLLVLYLIGGVLFGYKLFGVPGIILGLIVGGLMGVFGPDRVK